MTKKIPSQLKYMNTFLKTDLSELMVLTYLTARKALLTSCSSCFFFSRRVAGAKNFSLCFWLFRIGECRIMQLCIDRNNFNNCH